jgi:hypothetical protein
MRFRSTALCLLVSALVWIWAVVPLCAAVRSDAMPCCRSGVDCHLAMRASGCCRLGAISDQQTSLAPVAPSRVSFDRALFVTAIPILLPPASTTTALIVLGEPLGFLRHRAAGPPLFLLNTTLLR